MDFLHYSFQLFQDSSFQYIYIILNIYLVNIIYIYLQFIYIFCSNLSSFGPIHSFLPIFLSFNIQEGPIQVLRHLARIQGKR